MNLAVLRDARNEATRGLRDLLAEIEALRRKEQHLSAAIASLELAIGDESDSMLTALPAAIRSNEMEQISGQEVLEERPYWEVAKELLEEKNKPMTVPQMTLALTSRGYKVPGDSLRVAMIRRPDIFSKAGYGQYRLASWPKAETELDAEEGADQTPEEALEASLTPNTPYRSHMLASEGVHA